MKGALLNDKAEILCQFHRKYHPTFYSSVKVTQDPEIWRKALYDIARDVGDWCKDQNEEVEMISLTAQRTSIIPVDHKGDPLCDAVMWQDKRNIEVYKIGKIDREIYKCITEDIRTDEVIITDERIEHIRERRGDEFYARYSSLFDEILRTPDYIFREKREHTALVCKRIVEDEKYVNLVLRIAIETDNPEYKNSIITAIGESEKRFAQRLRNNIVLYKNE